MDLLFKRGQVPTATGSTHFSLWSKLELDDEEQALVKKYGFESAVLIIVNDAEVEKRAQWIGGAVFFAALYLLYVGGAPIGAILLIAGGLSYIAYYWYKHQYRETLYVRDLLHGRTQRCDSVIDLARKEAWIMTVVRYFRQVVESAKHWDGPERHRIEALPPDEARQVIIKGI